MGFFLSFLCSGCGFFSISSVGNIAVEVEAEMSAKEAYKRPT